MLKHHKKANVGVIFECLLQEVVSSFMEGNKYKADITWSILDRHFLSSKAPLGRELAFYEAISQMHSDEGTGRAFLNEISSLAAKTNIEQTRQATKKLLDEVSLTLGDNVINRYLDNYKLLASIHMLIESYRKDKTPLTVVERSQLEKVILEHISRETPVSQPVQPITEDIDSSVDPTVLNVAYKKFTKRYEDKLTKSQLDVVKTAMCDEANLPNKVRTIVSEIQTRVATLKDPTLREQVNQLVENFDETNLDLVSGLKYAQLLDEME